MRVSITAGENAIDIKEAIVTNLAAAGMTDIQVEPSLPGNRFYSVSFSAGDNPSGVMDTVLKVLTETAGVRLVIPEPEAEI